MVNFFGLEQIALEIAATVAVGAWTAFKSKDFFKAKHMQTLLEGVEAGVNQSYLVFVAERKANSDDGKLTQAERVTARTKALNAAKIYCKLHGTDIISRFGEDFIVSKIEKQIRKSKRESYRKISYAEFFHHTSEK